MNNADFFDDQDLSTETSLEQERIEWLVSKRLTNKPDDANLVLRTRAHAKYLKSALEGLPSGFVSLDASQPWLVYWTVAGMDALGELDGRIHIFSRGEPARIESYRRILAERVCCHLQARQLPTGGFVGGCHYAHLASTYAAVSALAVMQDARCLDMVDRVAMKAWLTRRKCPETGGFSMHEGGEVDVRGLYCALAVMRLLGLDGLDELLAGTMSYLVSCQSYEGGIGSQPGGEAHGGYTFCGMAAAELIVLLGGPQEQQLDMDAMLRWLVHRQMVLEGGYQGRTNKLVDACYSWWQGATAARCGPTVVDHLAVQRYILLCTQSKDGGLCDKPGTQRDLYHTCYALMGLAAAQHASAPLGGVVLPVMDLLHGMRTSAVEFALNHWAKA